MIERVRGSEHQHNLTTRANLAPWTGTARVPSGFSLPAPRSFEPWVR
jgi:hypothetical protein